MLEGLLVMLMWGTGTYLQSISVRKIGAIKTMFIANLLTILIPLAAIFFYPIKISEFNMLLICISGIFLCLGLYFFYRSVEIGEIAIVAPINGAYSLVTVALSVLFLDEKLGLIKGLAIFIIVSGVALISTNLKRFDKGFKGVRESIIGMFFQGISFFLLGIIAKDALFFGIRSEPTDVMTVFMVSGILNALLFFSLAALIKGVPKREDYKKDILWILGLSSIIFAGAWIIFNYGLAKSDVSLHVPISSLSPAITILLAVLFMKEKLEWNQKLGIILTMLGVFIIGF